MSAPRDIRDLLGFDFGKAGAAVTSEAQAIIEAHTKPLRIAFLFDATASRQETWDEAQAEQAALLKRFRDQKKIEVGVFYFRDTDEVAQIGDMWYSPAQVPAMVRAMKEIDVVTGETQIAKAIRYAVKQDKEKTLSAMVLVGDCCEEQNRSIRAAGMLLKEKNIPAFCIHEDTNGYDEDALRKGEGAYKILAETSGGAFAKLSGDVPMKELFYVITALQALGSSKLKELLEAGNKAAAALVKSNPLLLTGPDKGPTPPRTGGFGGGPA